MEDLNKLAEKEQKLEEAAGILKQYEEIIRTKRKGTVTAAYYQDFQTRQGEGKVYTDGKRIKDPQKYYYF